MSTTDLSSRVVAGRYAPATILREGKVTTVAATDLETGQSVVLKTTAAVGLSATSLVRLEHEASVLRRLRSGCLAPLLDVGVDNGVFFVVTPLVEGITLARRIERGPLNILESIAIARCVTAALVTAHEASVLHCDIKPGNVIVPDDALIQGAVLIDFGLARSVHLAAPVRDQRAGSVRYMSPEQAGLLNQDADERADLYSLGVTMFECLAGDTPFVGPTLGDVLRQHLSSPVPTLRGIGVAVPCVIDEIIQRLLQKNPTDRYQSARALLADLEEVDEQLRRGIEEPRLVIGSLDERSALTDPVFVGRDRELALLERELDVACRGEGRLVLLEADSGGGKTRLLQEFEHRASRRGCLVLRGEAVSDAPDRPFQILTGMVLGLLAEARSDAGFAAKFQEGAWEERDLLLEMLPELQGVLQVDAPPEPRQHQPTETAALWAMSTLLDALGSSERPAVILLDDCQWADELSSKFLRFWESRTLAHGPRRHHVMVVAAFRAEEVPESHPLRQAEGAAIRLAPLTRDELANVAESMAGALPEAAIDTVLRLSEGNPFVVLAVLRGLVESGLLVHRPSGGWDLKSDSMQLPQSSRQAAVFLAQRLASLPETSMELLSAGAVLGRQFDLDRAARLAGQKAEVAFLALEDARRRHLIWARSTTGVFVHDRVREAVLGRLDVETRARLHLRAAEDVARENSDGAYDLAYHYDAAGRHEHALPYALTAARLARSRYALESAENQLRIAERGSAQASTDVRLEVAEGLGQVLTLRGRYEEAASQLSRALSLASDDLARARIEGELGELAFKGGHIPEASRRIEEALKLLGRRIPRKKPVLIACLAWEVCVQLYHGLRVRLGIQRVPGGDERRTLAARLYGRLVYPWWFGRNTLAACWVLLKQLNSAERYLPDAEVANASSLHAATMAAAIPLLLRRGERYSQRAIGMYAQLGDLFGRGKAISFYYGVVLHAACRFHDAIARCDEAFEPLERTGEFWELSTARWHKALSLYRLGDLEAAAKQSKEIYTAATRLGDRQGAAIAAEIWAKAARGKIPRDLIEEALRNAEGDVQSIAAAMQADAVRLLREGQAAQATRVLEEAERLIDAAGVKNVYVCSIFPWLATARRVLVAAASPVDPQRRRQLLRQARRSARRSRRYSHLYRADLPHALREAALIAAMNGARRRARRLLRRSLAEARRQGAVAEEAETLRAERAVAVRGGEGGPADYVSESLRRPFAELDESTATPGLAQRFETLLAAGRRMTSATTPEEITASIRATVLELLRAEECVLVDVSSGALFGIPELDGLDPVAGRSLIDKALAARQPVTYTDVISDEPSASESMILAGIKSALCAPILIGDDPYWCVLATHRRVPGLFGEEEERLAGFIATLAGEAMERALRDQETRKQVIAAQEQERARVARDLHDETGQALTSLMLGLRMLQADLENPGSRGKSPLETVNELREATAGALRDVRKLAFELRPTILDDLGLIPALRRLTRDIAARQVLEVPFLAQMVDEKERFRSDVETAVYRVTQEALTNVVRHAQATMCSVVLARVDNQLRVVIEDDGAGFAPETVSSGSFGLRGMAERAALVGGSLTMSGVPGEGTSIILEVPVD